MKYALLVYDDPVSSRGLSTDEKRALHSAYHAVNSSPAVTNHYRLRPPRMVTTIRVEEDRILKAEGPLTDTGKDLRAIYFVDSDDHDSVLELAAQLPAARMGGAVEVWVTTEPQHRPTEPRADRGGGSTIGRA